MADAAQTLNYLVSEFKTSPAGTREEAEMAQSLSEAIHLHGLETIKQDFTYAQWSRPLAAIMLVLLGVCGILGGLTSGALHWVMLILAVLAAAVFVLEVSGRQLVSKLLPKGYSQNLIARYPALGPNPSKSRPVVILAHYDTPRADVMSLPILRELVPYVKDTTYICGIVILVVTICQLFPLPQWLHTFFWAVAIVAGIIVILSGVRILLNVFVLPYTSGANDNMSSVAAVLGVIDRAVPAMDEELVSRIAEKQERGEVAKGGVREPARRQATAEDDDPEARIRARRRSRRLADAPIRRGESVLRSLQMVPESCEIVYEAAPDQTVLTDPVPTQPAAQTGVQEGQDEFTTREQPLDITDTEQAVLREPVIVPEAKPSATGQQAPAGQTSGAIQPAGDRQATRAVKASQAAQVSQDTGTTVLTSVADLSAPAPVPVQDAASEKTVTVPAIAVTATKAAADGQVPANVDATRVLAPEPAIPGATSVLTHETLNASRRREEDRARVQALAPEPAGPIDVLISSDEPDAELRRGVSVLPRDVVEQQGATTEEARRDSILNNPNWGTTSFTPVQQSRHVIEDLPDPAVAAIDPFSVSNVETIGDLDPNDFSAMNFETGTHAAVTPQMLEQQRRQNLDGFEDLTADNSRRARRERKKYQGERISRRAAKMQEEMQEQSFTDWLGVDDDYDASKNGRQIGSWDNFEDGQAAQPDQSGQALPTDLPDPGDDPRGNGHRWQGGAVRARRPRRQVNPEPQEDQDEELRQAAMVLGDPELISHEIWFVLTGASSADHAGMKEFIKGYDQRLHNAYFINLSCVGAGKETLVLEEGAPQARKADRNLVNLLGTASKDLGRSFALARLPWMESEGAVALRAGRHSVTLCGMQDGVPANSGSTQDTADKVSPAMVDDVVDVLVEVIKRA